MDTRFVYVVALCIASGLYVIRENLFSCDLMGAQFHGNHELWVVADWSLIHDVQCKSSCSVLSQGIVAGESRECRIPGTDGYTNGYVMGSRLVHMLHMICQVHTTWFCWFSQNQMGESPTHMSCPQVPTAGFVGFHKTKRVRVPVA